MAYPTRYNPNPISRMLDAREDRLAARELALIQHETRRAEAQVVKTAVVTARAMEASAGLSQHRLNLATDEDMAADLYQLKRAANAIFTQIIYRTGLES